MKTLIKRIWLWFQSTLDWHLVILAALLSFIGLITLYSATRGGHESKFLSQCLYFVFAWLLMWVTTRVKSWHIQQITPFIYLMTVLLLLIVWHHGIVVKNSRRWLYLGFIRIQPSELAKIVTPLMVAWLFSIHSKITVWHYSAALIVTLIPASLVLIQPDLGTALLIGISGLTVLYFALLSWRIIFASLGLLVLSLPIVWQFILEPYQKKRILAVMDPSSDPLGACYHIIQSTIAIGSGGQDGSGWLQGSQSHLDFIPERHTDFIFAVFAEERGFFGATLLLFIFTLLLIRCLYIAGRSDNRFQRLSVSALTIVIYTYTVVNIGMVSGLLPVVGLPLPFFSYGGTALLTLFITLGMIMRVASNVRHKKFISQSQFTFDLEKR